MKLVDDREVVIAVYQTLHRFRYTSPLHQAKYAVEAIDNLLAARKGVTTGPWLRADRKNGRPDSE